MISGGWNSQKDYSDTLASLRCHREDRDDACWMEYQYEGQKLPTDSWPCLRHAVRERDDS